MKFVYHGNGFIQVHFSDSVRMHIWHPDWPRTVDNALIHDHKFLFESTVLMGRLTNSIYSVDWRPDPAIRMPEYCHGMWQQGPGDKSADLERIGRAHVVLASSRTYAAGENYRFGGPGQFHDAQGLGLTVTMMNKIHVQGNHSARIVAMNDEEPDHAFVEPLLGLHPSQEEMREVFQQVTGQLARKAT